MNIVASERAAIIAMIEGMMRSERAEVRAALIEVIASIRARSDDPDEDIRRITVNIAGAETIASAVNVALTHQRAMFLAALGGMKAKPPGGIGARRKTYFTAISNMVDEINALGVT